MGGNEDAALEGGKVFLEPKVGFQIQVVGRLVQQKQIGVAEENSGQGSPHGPAAAEFADGTGEIGLLKAQAREYRLGLMVPIVATGSLQGRIQPGKALQQFVLNVWISLDGQRFLGGGDVVRDGPCLHPRVQNFLEQGLSGKGCCLLLEIADGEVSLPGEGARIRSGFTGQDIHEGGLAGPVGTNKCNAVAGANVQGEIAEQRPVRVGLADVGSQ